VLPSMLLLIFTAVSSLDYWRFVSVARARTRNTGRTKPATRQRASFVA
jgi:hypothetical protein